MDTLKWLLWFKSLISYSSRNILLTDVFFGYFCAAVIDSQLINTFTCYGNIDVCQYPKTHSSPCWTVINRSFSFSNSLTAFYDNDLWTYVIGFLQCSVQQISVHILTHSLILIS